MTLYTLDNKLIKETYEYPINFTGMIEWPSGIKSWYLNGAWHRIGGPAVEYPDGRNEWWINKKSVTEEQHNLLVDIMKLKGFYD